MDADLEGNVGKPDLAEDDDAWLYGAHGTFYIKQYSLRECEIL